MTVADLIAALQGMDQSLPVVVTGDQLPVTHAWQTQWLDDRYQSVVVIS